MAMQIEPVAFLANELSEEIQKKVADKYWDWDVDWGWWECTYDKISEAGKALGLWVAVQGFDLGRNQDISLKGHLDGMLPLQRGYGIDDLVDRMDALRGEADEIKVDLFATLTLNLFGRTNFNCFAEDQDGEDMLGMAEELEDILRGFAAWALHSLEAEYKYLISKECVIESLTANEIMFDADGNRLDV